MGDSFEFNGYSCDSCTIWLDQARGLYESGWFITHYSDNAVYYVSDMDAHDWFSEVGEIRNLRSAAGVNLRSWN